MFYSEIKNSVKHFFFLSGLLLFCDRFQLSFWDLFGFETQVKFNAILSLAIILRTRVFLSRNSKGLQSETRSLILFLSKINNNFLFQEQLYPIGE